MTAPCLKQIRLSNDLPALRPKLGEILTCRIVEPDQGGYKVYVGLGTQPGFLATRAKLRRCTIIKAEFFFAGSTREFYSRRCMLESHHI
jgi:hypothetical protein